MVKHILTIAAKDLRFAMNRVIAKIIFALRITCISKNGYYLMQRLRKYCLIILVCPLFHIRETVVCAIRPHNADIVLAPVVILG